MPKFSPSVLRQYCYDVMTASGVDSVCAEATAEMLVDAEVTGMSTHGVSRLSIYMERIQAGIMSPNNNIRIVQEAPSALTVDAGNSLGAAAAKFTMTKCIEKARETGVCFAAVRNSNHFGVGGYYAMMAEREDMLGMCFTNTQAICVPTFGREVMLGTNPIAFAMPADPIPMLYDVATTVVPRGKLEVYAKQGKPMPLGWAVDENGKDTSDAKRVIDNIDSEGRCARRAQRRAAFHARPPARRPGGSRRFSHRGGSGSDAARRGIPVPADRR